VNEILRTIARRRSVRVFDGRPVDPALVRRLLEAANQAPSAHNSQSWRFTLLGAEKKKELAALVGAKASGFPRPTSVLLRMGARTIAGAPVVIAVSNTGELMRRGADLFPSPGGKTAISSAPWRSRDRRPRSRTCCSPPRLSVSAPSGSGSSSF
jgi:nitroreductase